MIYSGERQAINFQDGYRDPASSHLNPGRGLSCIAQQLQRSKERASFWQTLLPDTPWVRHQTAASASG